MHIEDRTGDQPCQAVCAAVCACHKLLTFAIEDDSFNQQKFESFLEQVRDACKEEKVYLFLDNSGVHKACKAKMAELDIVPVWNVAYMPEYNLGIERYWADLKAYFRPLLLSKMIKDPRKKDRPLKDSVRQAIRDVSTEPIPTYCQRGLERLSSDAAVIRHERKMLSFSDVAVCGSPKK